MSNGNSTPTRRAKRTVSPRMCEKLIVAPVLKMLMTYAQIGIEYLHKYILKYDIYNNLDDILTLYIHRHVFCIVTVFGTVETGSTW